MARPRARRPGLVEPRGLFVTAALRRCRGYTVAGKTFPGADIDEHDVRTALQPEFAPLDGTIEVRRTAQDTTHGYSAIVLCRARRRPGTTRPGPPGRPGRRR